MNPDSRFNVINPIDDHFSNYTGFRADNPFGQHQFVLDMAEHGSELQKYNLNN